ncbi:MAG: alpha/beta hydrolase [Myxococcales bacterium]|nr:alpha/beta hydrolase [Myxococcales bacterium]
MTPSNPAVRIVPRWAGTPAHDWYPWLCGQVPNAAALTMPDPGRPTIAGWTAAIADGLRGEPGELTLVAHSVGVHAALHHLAALPEDASVRAAVLVAAWWDIDPAFWASLGMPWSAIDPWIDYPLDFERARARVGAIEVLIADDDPFPRSSLAETAALWERRLGAKVRVCPGRRHFNAAQEPDVLAAVRRVLGAGQ